MAGGVIRYPRAVPSPPALLSYGGHSLQVKVEALYTPGNPVGGWDSSVVRKIVLAMGGTAARLAL